jgi:hypothetical protein
MEATGGGGSSNAGNLIDGSPIKDGASPVVGEAANGRLVRDDTGFQVRAYVLCESP